MVNPAWVLTLSLIKVELVGGLTLTAGAQLQESSKRRKAFRVQYKGKSVAWRSGAGDIEEKVGTKRDPEDGSRISSPLENHAQKLLSGWNGIPNDILGWNKYTQAVISTLCMLPLGSDGGQGQPQVGTK